jgi:predicted nucleic acid-binding Zn ribbon protein
MGVIFKGSGFYTTDYKRGSALTGSNGGSQKEKEKTAEKTSEKPKEATGGKSSEK